MKRVPLGRNHYALIDDCDEEFVSQWRWHLKITKVGLKYAICNFKSGRKKTTKDMHRLLLGVTDKTIKCDHVDGDGLNNQGHNLRVATNFQNGQNRRWQPHSSPYKGVVNYKGTGKWAAQIRISGWLKPLGYFDCPKKAATIYDAAAIQHFGEFAKTNQQMGLL